MEKSQYSSCSNFHWQWRVALNGLGAGHWLTWAPGRKVCLYHDSLPGSLGVAGDTIWRSNADHGGESWRRTGQWQFKQHRSAQTRIQDRAAHGPHWNADIATDHWSFNRYSFIDHDSRGLLAAKAPLAFRKCDWRRYNTQTVPGQAYACTYHYKPQYSTPTSGGRSSGWREALRL